MIYNEQFIDFVHEIFPSIDPYVAERVKYSIDQFRKTGADVFYFTSGSLGDLSQGDIIDNLSFISFNDEGMLEKIDTLGMVVSNTCDVENDDDIILAPLIPIDNLGISKSGLDNLKKNRVFRFIYIPEGDLVNYVVDLGQVSKTNKNYVKNRISSNESTRVASLNQLGYYFFLCKLAVHFLRPEDTTVQTMRFELSSQN